MATLYKQGSRGEVVKQIQKALRLYPDGIWGPLTTEAVKQFQLEHGLKDDGIVGPATLAKLLPGVAKSALGLKRSKRRITEIIVHCTATPEYRDYTVADIRQWHKQQGWSDIGYHYVVYRDGTVHEGRDVDISGAHCTGHNASAWCMWAAWLPTARHRRTRAPTCRRRPCACCCCTSDGCTPRQRYTDTATSQTRRARASMRRRSTGRCESSDYSEHSEYSE